LGASNTTAATSVYSVNVKAKWESEVPCGLWKEVRAYPITLRKKRLIWWEKKEPWRKLWGMRSETVSKSQKTRVSHHQISLSRWSFKFFLIELRFHKKTWKIESRFMVILLLSFRINGPN
jgi:hypothetical protein